MNNAPTDSAEATQSSAGVRVQIHADPTVNYASYQNDVPLVRSLTLANAADEPLREDAPQTELLDALLENLGFLGRAESWVGARHAPTPADFNCVPADKSVDPETDRRRNGRDRALRPPPGLFHLTSTLQSPVAGPLCLGWGCHFGLGSYVPTPS